MAQQFKILDRTTQEILFQVVLLVLAFLFYTFDRNNPGIKFYQVVFFLSYALGAAIIGYYLMPRFLYRKKYGRFLAFTVLVIAGLILLEELVLEQLFFAGTKRAERFPGIFISLIGVVPLIAILTGFKFGWDALQKQEQIEELKSTIQESELQFLKSQINPHFLFNNLNNLYSYAIEQSPKTPNIILELSSVLRYMLYDCKEKFVALPKEIEHLKNFTKLNELQIEERGKVTFNTENIQAGYRIAPLILTVFIENAFKHSTASQSKDIFIDIDIKVTETGMLDFECKNSFQPATNTESLTKGIGLENVKKRLQLLYPDAHELQIQDDQGLYFVHLKMQLTPTAP